MTDFFRYETTRSLLRKRNSSEVTLPYGQKGVDDKYRTGCADSRAGTYRTGGALTGHFMVMTNMM